MTSTVTTLLFIALAAVLAPLISEWTGHRIPGVVIELGAGILIGPQLLDLAQTDPIISTMGTIGLTFLFFMAGFELDFQQIRGEPLRLAAWGWGCSLVLAFGAAGLMVVLDMGISTLIIGLALTTTALGTLLPILSENRERETRFGSFVIAIGGAGEFLPIVAIALLLTSDNALTETLLLLLFIALAAGALALALRPRPPRFQALMSATLNSASQLPIRIAVLLIVLLVWVASHLGLDTLLGGFVAGLVIRLSNQGDNAEIVEAKLSALSYGLFVPIFFVVSGMEFDLDALTHPTSTLLRVPFFLVMFLIVRGVPVFLLYRRALPRHELVPAALLSAAALPLVVAITSLGVQEGRMRPANAAALVGAGMLSMLILPASAFALRRRSERRRARAGPPDVNPAAT